MQARLIPAIVVHGGAGRIDDQRHERCAAGCAAAAAAGLEVLAAGGSALDAVERAVCVLEEDAEFNAGVGAALSRDGTVELDASIMDGATLRVGAVAAVPELRRPVGLARALLEDGEHVLLAGEAAWAFALERGFHRAAPGEMVSARAERNLEEWRAKRAAATAQGGGTVGACAIDAAGHVAAATSTGGISGKRRGRVGDTPLPGCGTYADDEAGAASGTGHGESIIRVTLTRVVVDRLRAGDDAAAAARRAIDELAARTGGTAGVICVDRGGRVGLWHNTDSMSWAHSAVGGEVRSGARVQRP